jgi:hypothetical protein
MRRQIVTQLPNIEFLANPFTVSTVVPSAQTDREISGVLLKHENAPTMGYIYMLLASFTDHPTFRNLYWLSASYGENPRS